MLARMRNVRYCFPVLISVLCTLMLLTFIGYNEAKLKYLPFQLNKLAAQAEIVKNSFDSYLNAGLPLSQFSGFHSVASTLIKSDESIENVRVLNQRGQVIFFVSSDGSKLEDFEQRTINYKNSPIEFDFPAHRSLESEFSFVVEQKLKSKFGPVGTVVVESKKEVLLAKLNSEFKLSFQAIGTLTLLFLIVVTFYELVGSNKVSRSKVLKLTYVFCYVALAVLISKTVYNVYEYGANATTRAMTESMVHRLGTAKDAGIYLDDLSGIDRMLDKYKAGNRTIEAIALIKGEINIAHTDTEQVGKVYQLKPGCYEHINILGTENGQALDFRVIVNIPTDVLLRTILASTKAFIVLFIACALVAMIFLNAGTSLIELLERKGESISVERRQKDRGMNFEIGLSLVQPAYFMIVMVNALFVPFLPALIADIAEQSHYSFATASLPFTLYYLFFALVLIPAGQYAERGNLKHLMAFGFVAELAGMLLIVFTDDYMVIVFARILSGIGQGFFLIGLQSYIVVITPQRRRSRGHAVKVVGRNSALIAGTAIGALLYAYMDYRMIFLLASIISLVSVGYLLLLVPRSDAITGKLEQPDPTEEKVNPWVKLRLNTVAVMRDSEFVKTLTLVGLWGKMSIAGVVMFGLPLLMIGQGYATDDVGLILMVYYVSSMIMTSYISRFVDGAGNSRRALVWSALMGGVATVLIGIVSHQGNDFAGLMPGMGVFAWMSSLLMEAGLGSNTLLLYSAILLLGVSNGLLAAPVMTHINNTNVSRTKGVKQVAATYVFLERFGHVAGPAVVAQLLFWNDNSPLAIALFGVVMAVFGVLYMSLSQKPDDEKLVDKLVSS